VEPISPELVLVDPELAQRARALLPDLAGAYVSPEPPAAAAAPAPRTSWLRARRDGLIRVAAWCAVPSIALNVAFLRTDSAAEPAPVAAPSRVVTVTVAPIAPSARPRHGVAAARHEQAVPTRPKVAGPHGVLRWPEHGKALAYDVVVWRGHRRIADVWTQKPKIAVASLACRGSRTLAAGRYLWFVYPLVKAKPRRYGHLARWGTFAVGAHTRCPKHAKPAR
jgi:hypothetical protein